MTTNQPSYHCITNIGDVNPEEYGGQFVCIDKTGFYDHILLVYDADFDTLYDITLTRCIRVDDESVSDNVYHPSSCAWFGDKESIKTIAEFTGRSVESIVNSLCSSSPIERAIVYKNLFDYWGAENFDTGITLKKEKVKIFLDKMQSQIEESNNFHQGYF